VSDLAALQTRLGYTFGDAALLQIALTHPSAVAEAVGQLRSNQRLEFLGDAVLSLVLTHAIYEKFPEEGEGLLTKARAALVNGQALAAHASALDLGACLVLARGEEQTGGRQKTSALADAFEAVLGALYLDGGFAAVREFILREFASDLQECAFTQGIENPKGELQELLQANSAESPHYEIVTASGPDHDREFECVVRHAGAELARGRGKSKKAAESAAARAALVQLREASRPAESHDPTRSQSQS